MTTADYLTQLQQDREDLVDNLEAKGITGLSGDETFTELVPEVLNIPSGSSGVDWSDIGYTNEPALIDYLHSKAKEVLADWDKDNPHTFKNDLTIVAVPSLDLSNTSTNDEKEMFYGCSNLICVADTYTPTTFGYWFYNCTNLRAIDISNFSTERFVLNVSGSLYMMFSGCTNLEHVEFGNFEVFDVTRTSNIYRMFYGCTKLDDDTLDQILRLAILVGPNLRTADKKISTLGITDSTLLATIPSLNNYEEFIAAGWTLS